MSLSSIGLSDELTGYLRAVSLREHPVLADLRGTTAELAEARMQVSAEQGALLQLLVRLVGARRTLEVGVFTGYSSLAVALALPPGGQVVACDVSEEWTRIARKHWSRAGVEDRIQLELGPAEDTLQRLLDDGGAGSFDFAFIDADKPGYARYWALSLQLVRPGGLIAVDNTLWEGKVVDPSADDDATVAIRAFNALAHSEPSVDLALIPIGDGLTLARRRLPADREPRDGPADAASR